MPHASLFSDDQLRNHHPALQRPPACGYYVRDPRASTGVGRARGLSSVCARYAYRSPLLLSEFVAIMSAMGKCTATRIDDDTIRLQCRVEGTGMVGDAAKTVRRGDPDWAEAERILGPPTVVRKSPKHQPENVYGMTELARFRDEHLFSEMLSRSGRWQSIEKVFPKLT